MKKEWFITGLFIVSLAGLLWGRAILSISMGIWLFFSLWHFRLWIHNWYKNPVILWGITPVILGLLGIWQSPDNAAGWDHLLTLTTYPVLALSAVCITSIEPRIFRTLSYCWILAALLAVLYPLGWYIFNSQYALERYSSGQSLPVFMDNDHVRFSIFLSGAVLLAWFNRNRHKWLLPVCIFLLLCIIFLSARTGWMLVLLMGLIVSIQTFSNQQDRKKGIIIFFALLSICIAAWLFFPTVQHKMGYSFYDWKQYVPGKYDPTLSDNTRYAVNKAAWYAIISGQQNIGWAHIPNTLQNYFGQLFPTYTTGFGWPFNQWLFWWMGSGWWGMLLFTIWLFFPAYLGWRKKNMAAICWTFAIAASCLVECNLGYQYGVWLHGWIIIRQFVPHKAG
ncbi:O-antigen ligase family protein [Sediminibacterium goheungense]|uniref:O-antigen ligase-like membrane protein n=1 Tax=Sediminibacterium goheungense TaxID=1086393 RepID=A0A4R6IUU9_9BACT|nr:hypothetical protein [Sediminibacterium goheungense]TDO26399.1 hypothetical protein BC659_1705 [Sediminibacterium goheungense]